MSNTIYDKNWECWVTTDLYTNIKYSFDTESEALAFGRTLCKVRTQGVKSWIH